MVWYVWFSVSCLPSRQSAFWLFIALSCNNCTHKHASVSKQYNLVLAKVHLSSGHFPRQSGLTATRKSPFWILLELRMMEVVSGDNWNCETCKAPVITLPPTHQHQLFTGRMSFLLPNQQCRSTEGESITFRGLAHPKLTWGLTTLSLTTKGSWLPEENGCKHYRQSSDAKYWPNGSDILWQGN